MPRNSLYAMEEGLANPPPEKDREVQIWGFPRKFEERIGVLGGPWGSSGKGK